MTTRLAGLVLFAVVVTGCSAVPPAPAPSPSRLASAGSEPAASVVSAAERSPSANGASSLASPSASASADPMPSPFAGPCQSDVAMGVLPAWAREGFSEPEPAMPHVLSHSGDVVAIVFGFPLASPPRDGVNNKILWVHREGPTPPVEISAQQMEGTDDVGEPVDRALDGGFGPSIVDLPAPGCWRLTLTYGDRTDSIDLEYIQTPAG